VAFAAPAIFSMDGSGAGQGYITITGPEVVAASAGAFPGSRPAKRGESLTIYCTGLGPVSQIQGDGTPKTKTSPVAISQTPNVTIGGAPATVTFAGLTQGGVGLYQVNVQVPDAVPSGAALPVLISMTGKTSNSVTVAVE
jgi:uncharacterized protein (TIGR03437 family)